MSGMELLINSANTFEIMRVLEDVKNGAAVAPEAYLGQLAVYLRGDTSTALRKLEEVRLALARNLARSLVVDIHEPY